jgi:hypothetical protein
MFPRATGGTTLDLLASRQTGLKDLLTRRSASHERAEGPMLSAEDLEPYPSLAFALVNLELVERRLRVRLDALGP